MTACNGSQNPIASGKPAHPCFEPGAMHTHARIHLPIAPRCNVQCNFCDRKYSCSNESRPGVTASVLNVEGAINTVRSALQAGIPLSVVGIAGPGDAFANPAETFETLRAIRSQFPELLLCLSTNGLEILPWIDEIEEIGVSHITVTVNAVDPVIAAEIYKWVRFEGVTYKGLEAGEVIVRQQALALEALATRNFTVKVNSVVIPGINLEHIPEIARRAQELGADLHNCIPLIPVESTPFGVITAPEQEDIARIRGLAGEFLPQMAHCSRCRADACGILGQS